jgi:H+-transporting ATPase
MRFDVLPLRTLAIVTPVFSGQAILYVVRERHHFWSFQPSNWLMFSSVLDLTLDRIRFVGEASSDETM